MEIYLEKEKRTIEFERIPINFERNNLDSLFFIKNNKTLSETLKSKRYSPLKDILGDISKENMNTPIGLFLKKLKESLHYHRLSSKDITFTSSKRKRVSQVVFSFPLSN